MADNRNVTYKGELLTITVWQQRLISSGCWPCCLNCGSYSPSRGCELAKPPRFPPPEIIVVGCPAWTDDIPF